MWLYVRNNQKWKMNACEWLIEVSYKWHHIDNFPEPTPVNWIYFDFTTLLSPHVSAMFATLLLSSVSPLWLFVIMQIRAFKISSMYVQELLWTTNDVYMNHWSKRQHMYISLNMFICHQLSDSFSYKIMIIVKSRFRSSARDVMHMLIMTSPLRLTYFVLVM